ncbi:XRE family transcriptional regulator [Alicyclobacillaceae bacterium I2511]|nr:XRE family transcriptional regulator [Alicyclobacillaceae bacterium I2511]
MGVLEVKPHKRNGGKMLSEQIVVSAEEWRESLGAELRQRRIAGGITQVQLADKTHYHVRAIQRAEQGKASISMYQTICSSLGVEVAIMIGDSEYLA